MAEQVIQLRRSDKNYIAGRRAVIRKLDEEYRELAWFDKNIELIKAGRLNELYKLWQTVDR